MPASETPRADGAASPLVEELRRGHRVDRVFLVENSNFKQTRNNKFFIQADLRDRTGAIKAIRWEAPRELFDSFQVDDFVHVTGRVEEFQQNLQIIVDDIYKVAPSSVDVSAFLPVTSRDVDAMERDLMATVESLGDPHLVALLRSFVGDPEILAAFRRCPAGKTLHHATIGGLLEHVTSLSRAADLVCKNYPLLNRDLLQAGVILHDIGKIRELAYSRSFKYTDIGQLVGHIAIGIAWVTEKARTIQGFPEEVLVQVLHLIASHHGEPEFGAVKPPMTREAIVLHYLDNIDAKLALLEQVQREQRLGSEEENNWSAWHPAMGRRLFFS